jgi:CRISPR system Cascade subunit CasE
MYLSCYKLDIKYPEVRRALKNTYEMHRTVMSIFESVNDNTPRKKMGILYRLIARGRGYRLYISSLHKPVKEMPKGFNAVNGSPKDISKLINTFKEGMLLRFNLMAMPSKKIRAEGQKNSKRVFLGRESDRQQWLKKKAEQNGFEVLSYIEENKLDNKFNSGSGYKSVVFDGVLKIIDKDKFYSAYQHGIGAEKAFGCGMLLISRL